ncbi:3'-5' exonuclease [Azospirillum sp. 11R-A]|uniref:3'-5' exonuclease n=1 Tax=Azospirillum sp. 11R-A TaxID=3111634 RepID=UPI003C155D2B
MMSGSKIYEEMAKTLELSGEYKVLRKIKRRERYSPDDGSPKKIGVVIDLETTGLDPINDEIIEIGMIAFEFSSEGAVFSIIDTVESFRDPKRPLTSEVSEITGITDEMIKNKKLPRKRISEIILKADVIIAHNAAFDRKFFERQFPKLPKKAWACSLSEIAWKNEGVESPKLSFILNAYGLFHDGHRAAEDCLALLELMSLNLKRTGRPILKVLLDQARERTFRIWGKEVPFSLRNELKSNGYRWSDGENGKQKGWWKDVSQDDIEKEINYISLRSRNFNSSIDVYSFNAFDRYSERA